MPIAHMACSVLASETYLWLLALGSVLTALLTQDRVHACLLCLQVHQLLVWIEMMHSPFPCALFRHPQKDVGGCAAQFEQAVCVIIAGGKAVQVQLLGASDLMLKIDLSS